MSTTLIREHYDYHRWANHRLFDIAAGLGAEPVTRDLGKHWSFPTLKGMFAHMYGADSIWLARWKGESPKRLSGDADFPSMAGSPRALGRAGGGAARLRGGAGGGRPRAAHRVPEHRGQSSSAWPWARSYSTW